MHSGTYQSKNKVKKKACNETIPLLIDIFAVNVAPLEKCHKDSVGISVFM